MPIIEPAEQIGTVTLEDGRTIPRYKVKTETTLMQIQVKNMNQKKLCKQTLMTQILQRLLKKLDVMLKYSLHL